MRKAAVVAIGAGLLAMAAPLGGSMARDKGAGATKGDQSGCTKGGCGIFKSSERAVLKKKPAPPPPPPRPTAGTGGISAGKATYQDLH